MDEAVRRALARWPKVPAVFGWLRLDARGDWHVKNAATAAFEPISNAAIIAFIGRNYACDERGRYFFQNGPQRVFVQLEATPFVYRIADDSSGLVAHTDQPAGALRGLYLDETGALTIDAALGAGVLEDRDLGALFERVTRPDDGALPEATIEAVMRGERTADVALFGARLRLAQLRAGERARRFGFVTDPQP